MILTASLPPSITQSSLVAYVHYVSFMFCFGALVFERARVKANPARDEAIAMVIADIIYGIAGLSLLLSGIFRVIKYGQGSEFYIHNPLFWIKVGIFIVVGLLSLYPTITYLLWAIPLSKGDLPKVSDDLVARLRIILNVELLGFTLIPLFATLMARGIGLNW